MERPDKFLLLIIAFCLGVFLASFNISFFFFLFFGFIIGLIAFYPLGSWVFKIFLIVVFLGGAFFYFKNDYLHEKEASWYISQEKSSYEAVIISQPEIKEFSIWFRAKLDKGMKVLVKSDLSWDDLEYGDRIKLKGKLERPVNKGDFNLENYLKRENIYLLTNRPKIDLIAKGEGGVIKSWLFEVKNIFLNQINSFLPEPESSFLSGLLLGSREDLPRDIKDNLSKSGTSHLIALSGFNITIISSAVISLFLFLGISRGKSFWFSAFFILLFVLLVGASASIVRAAIMGVLFLLSQKIGWMYNPKNSLFLAGAIMILVNPQILRFDISFQLSFLATWGLLYLNPFFENILKGDKESFLNWRETLSLTLSAQIAVLPLLILYFNYISFISPLANLLILAIIPLTMLLGFIALVTGFFIPILGSVFSFFVFLLLKYEIWIVNFFGELPIAGSSIGQISKYIFIIISIFLVGGVFLKGKKYGEKVY